MRPSAALYRVFPLCVSLHHEVFPRVCAQECRQQLRHLFHTEEQLGLLEREKRAHCYPVALLDRVFLSNPALPCHKTCLGGIRVLIRLWNGVAAAEVTYPTLRPVSSDSVPSARPETGSSTEFESSDVISDLGIPAPSAGHRHMTRNSSIRQSHRDSPSRSLLRGPRLDPLALPTLSTDKSNLKRSSSLASLGSLGDFHLPSLSTNVSPQQPVSPPPGDLFPTHTFTGAHTRNLLAIKKQRQQGVCPPPSLLLRLLLLLLTLACVQLPRWRMSSAPFPSR